MATPGRSERRPGIAAPGAVGTTVATDRPGGPAPSREWARMRVAVAPLLGITVAALLAAVTCQARPVAPAVPAGPDGRAPSLGATGAGAGAIRVHVAGAVQSPGVYELRVGDRVQEAIRAAGGTTAEADGDSLNLAQRVHDEQRLDVPDRGANPVGSRVPAGSARGGVPGVTPDAARAGRDSTAPAPTSGADHDLAALLASPMTPDGGPRLDINRATVAQLEKLPGIGEISAKKVATWRADNGAIRTVVDLRAAGLSTAILLKALPYLALE